VSVAPSVDPVVERGHRKRGRPFTGGGVDRKYGKFRWRFTFNGVSEYGPLVSTEAEADDGRRARLVELGMTWGDQVPVAPPARQVFERRRNPARAGRVGPKRARRIFPQADGRIVHSFDAPTAGAGFARCGEPRGYSILVTGVTAAVTCVDCLRLMVQDDVTGVARATFNGPDPATGRAAGGGDADRERKAAEVAGLEPWIHRLPPGRREVAAGIVAGKTAAQLADSLGKNIQSVNFWFARAVRELRRLKYLSNQSGESVGPEPVVATQAPVRVVVSDPLASVADAPIAALPPVIDGHEAEAPAVDRVRRKLRVIDGRVRAKTIPIPQHGGLTRDERRAAEELPYPADVDRPRSRLDCQGMPRPCPFVSCSHHLYLDVNPNTGALKLNFPHLDVHEMAETCSLDVADRGGITLEEVGAILNLSRERIRQVEVRGLCKIKDHTGGELGLPPERRG